MKPRVLTLLVAALLLMPTLAMAMATSEFPIVQPVITFVAGNVTVKGAAGSVWDPAEVGRLLSSGDSIRTGPASKAEISCATGKMRLYENTVIIIPEVVDEGDKKDIRAVTLEDGAGLFRIKKRGVEKGFEVQTSNIIAGVKGTLFGVLHNKTEEYSRVAVYSGVVEVTDRDRSPSTKTTLGQGRTLDIRNLKGFGEGKDFDPVNIWKEWEKRVNPDASFLGVSAAVLGIRPLYEPWPDDEGGGDYQCPPVVDNDGNVVVR